MGKKNWLNIKKVTSLKLRHKIKSSEQKIRVGLKQTQADPFDWFKDKSKNQTITVKVVSTDNKGLIVRPEGCEMDFQIKNLQLQLTLLMLDQADGQVVRN